MKYVSLFKEHNQPPWHCHFCGELVEKLYIHHLDHDHYNNELTNLVAVHKRCHDQHHLTGRTVTWGDKISQAKKRQWQDGVYDGVFTPEVRAKAAASNTGKRASHCWNGHEFTEENTYVPPRGGRVCRACVYNRNLIARGGDRNSLR
jgi:hypothetical protein